MVVGKLGPFGEDKAVEYLQKRGYRIIKRNYRKKWGEIDIITYDRKTSEFVFIEVKTRLITDFFSIMPEEELTSKKIQRLKRVFLSYLSSNKLDEKSWRFDFVAVYFQDLSSSPEIKHYKDVFLSFD